MDNSQKKPWKYSYWLDESNLEQLKKEMNDRGITMTSAQYSPCQVLRGAIGYAEPQVWPVLCKPDATPWYSESKFNGKNLVVSSFPLNKQFQSFLETTITPVSFQPSRMPSLQEQQQAVRTLYPVRGGWGKVPHHAL